MVTINTSTSFSGGHKSEEASSEADSSGLENIFASMFSLNDEKNSSLSLELEATEATEAASLLSEIKKQLGDKKNELNSGISGSENSEIFSTNVLKIYESFKALIDETTILESDPTISFSIEDSSELDLEKNILASSKVLKKMKSSIGLDQIAAKTVDTPQQPESELSFEEFSKAEMARLKANLKQSSEPTIDKENKTKEIEGKSLGIKTLLENKQTQAKFSKGTSPLLTQNNRLEIQSGQQADTQTIEHLNDQTSSSSRLGTLAKANAFELNTQSNQNLHQTQLKILEKNWGKDLAKIIERALASGKEKIDISRDPQKLGKMHLTLSVVNNQTSIMINTENTAASLILSGAEERLSQMFEASGLKLSNFQTNSNNGNSGKNNSNSKQNKNPGSLNKSSDIKTKPTENPVITQDENGRKIINLIA